MPTASAVPGGGLALLLGFASRPFSMLVSFASPVVFFSAIGNDRARVRTAVAAL